MSFSAADAFQLFSRCHARDRLAHAYLITGPEGSGKRSLVTQVAGLILGSDDPLKHPDAHILEPESKSRRIRTDAVREVERELQMRSLRGGKKVGIFFDADRLQEQAANAFLKTLEEPPANTHLFLLSSLPSQLLDTILSRCIQVPLRASERVAPVGLPLALIERLRTFAKISKPDLAHVFLFVRGFQELLAQAKQTIKDENDAALKKEEPLYKQVGNKGAFEAREEYFSALTESRYIGERSRLLTILEQWWADVLRQKVCMNESGDPVTLDLPEFSEDTRQLAARFTETELLKKNTVLGTLRGNLSRNIQEQLAIEVGFLKAFSQP